MPKIIPPNRNNPPQLRCLGYGLVRSISPTLRRYFIVTPISDIFAKKVDVIALGHGIQTPNILFDKDVSGTLLGQPSTTRSAPSRYLIVDAKSLLLVRKVE